MVQAITTVGTTIMALTPHSPLMTMETKVKTTLQVIVPIHNLIFQFSKYQKTFTSQFCMRMVLISPYLEMEKLKLLTTRPVRLLPLMP